MGIKSVVDENVGKASGDLRDGMCSACEMAVVWMQNQIKQNQTQEQILNYVNQVNNSYVCGLPPNTLFPFIVFSTYSYCDFCVQLCERLPSPMGESSVDCGSLSSLPKVSFTIGEKKFELTPEQVLYDASQVLSCPLNISSVIRFPLIKKDLIYCMW